MARSTLRSSAIGPSYFSADLTLDSPHHQPSSRTSPGELPRPVGHLLHAPRKEETPCSGGRLEAGVRSWASRRIRYNIVNEAVGVLSALDFNHAQEEGVEAFRSEQRECSWSSAHFTLPYRRISTPSTGLEGMRASSANGAVAVSCSSRLNRLWQAARVGLVD